MPNPNAKKGVVVVVKRRGSGCSVAAGSGSASGARRPATTTATNTTDDSTTTNGNTYNITTPGNVNNDGRVNNVPLPNKKVSNVGPRTTNRRRSSSTAAVTGPTARTPVNRTTAAVPTSSSRNNKSKKKKEEESEEEEPTTEDEEEEEEEDVEEEEEEEEVSKSKEQLAVAKNLGKLNVSGGRGGPVTVVLSGSSEDGTTSSPERTSSSEEEPPSEDCQSFFVIVNTDGSLVLDNTKQLQLGPGQERFAVNLPTNKIKSLDNPLPGAIQLPTPRARKSKPEGVTYGGSTDVGFIATTSGSSATGPEVIEIDLGGSKEASMSVGINSAHTMQSSIAPGGTGSIDMDEFTNQLDPQSLATLETLIDSEQGRELIETMDLNQVGTTVHINDAGAAVVKPPGWDHSHGYTDKNSNSSASVSVSSSTSSTANSPVHRNMDRSMGTSRSSSTGMGRPSSGGRLSEGDGNIRRSQRQQDRIERQEAERILAENQQMLQREKEIMKEASAQKLGSPAASVDSFPVSSPGPVVGKVVTSTPSIASPALPVTVEDRVASPENDSRRPYPKRENRKLPAHLADPNYVSLEDEGAKSVKDGTGSEKSSGSRRSSTQTKHEEPEEIADAAASTEDDDEDYTEDDPNRLWCICRQPHNNRFMICCDNCEEWFHGKCVNVTKAQGKAMELKNISWNCPPCRKQMAEKTKKVVEPPQNRGRSVSRRESDSTAKPSGKLSKAAAAQQAEAAAAAGAAKLAQTPDKIAAQSTGGTRKVNLRKSELEKNVPKNVHDCSVCGKPSRKDSIYCSDLCIQKSAESIGNKTSPASHENSKAGTESSPVPTSATPTTPTGTPGKDKLKRTNSLRTETKSDEPIFAFHVITPGATKSTEVVPPKPKELTASQLLKAQREQAASMATMQTSPIKTTAVSVPATSATSSHPTVQGVSPNSVNAIMSSTPTVVVKKMTTADGKSFVKLPGKISKELPLKIDTSHTSDEKNKSKDNENLTSPTKSRVRTTSSSAQDVKSKPAVTRKASLKSSDKEKDQPMKDRDGLLSEKLHRENMRKGLRELLKARMKEMTDEEQRKIAGGTNTPEILAEKIEDELIRVHGGASNPKCRAKYRSIYFNLKDSKNVLYQEILQGRLKPKVLVKMEPHELASAELSEWRKRETEKEIEAIKKAELDKYAETKKIQLLEKGVDDAVKVAEESRPLHINEIITSDSKDRSQDLEKAGPSNEKSKSHSHHTKTKSKDSSRSSEKEKDRDRRDRDSRRRSDRHKSDKERESSLKDKEKDKESSSRDKDRDRRTRGKERDSVKVKYSDSKDRDRKYRKGKESEKQRSTSSKSPSDSENKKSSDSEVTTPSETPSTSGEGTPSSLATPSDTKKTDARHSTDSEQELPSSTIKTPDFTDETNSVRKDSDSKPLFQTRIIMPELGGFNASAHAVSHFATEGLAFPESPVPIVGRISPETVWDYINKMKKSKEVIVFRLSPATPADSEGYMTFFSYFSSRGRLAVLGGIVSPLKDVYLVPLDKHSPVNRSLLPFRGPGLSKERTHCLLCVVTRHILGDASIPTPLKRKSTVSDQLAVASKKKVKLVNDKQKPTSSSSLTRSTPSTLTVPEAPTLTTPAPVEIVKEDDDAPYTPWEDEEEVKESPVEDTDKELLLLKASIGTPQSTAPSIDVQKQLQELEAKIAQERQDIEKITGALAGRNSTSGIPGLDGEFPEESKASEVTKKKDIPFFLRSTTESQGRKGQASGGIGLPGLEMQESSSQESMDICIESVSAVPDTSSDVIIVDSSSKEVSDPRIRKSMKNVKTAVEDPEEEAYSPSEMQFPEDDETPEVEESASKSITVTNMPTDITDDEPLPPGIESSGLEKKKVGKFIAAMEPVHDIKIVMKKPGAPSFTQEMTPSSSILSGSPIKVQRDFIDLGDDLEPPPPGDILSSPAPVRKSDPIFEEAAVFPKTLSSGNTAPAKMKININFTTKLLPSKDATPEQKKESPELISVTVPKDKASALNPSTNQPQTLPAHIPLPPLPIVQSSPRTMCIPHLNLQRPPPSLQLPPKMSLPQTLPPIPVHIPPPNMKHIPASASSVPTSVVINLNVPPPPIMNMMPRPITMPLSTGMVFPPIPCPPRVGFPNVPPPQLTTITPNLRPPFVSSFNEAGKIAPMAVVAGSSCPSIDRDNREAKRGFSKASPPEVDRVERLNLDHDNSRRDRDRSNRNRDSRGRNFGRRSFGRDSSDRNRRNRSRSRSNDRDRSRSRERRHRRRHSKSRSKSPLSRRWEASARNKSRSRSPGKRSRRRSRSSSPSRGRRTSGSPRKNLTKSQSNSRSKSPTTPKARHSSTSEKNAKHDKESEDWEVPSPLRESGEKQTAVINTQDVSNDVV